MVQERVAMAVISLLLAAAGSGCEQASPAAPAQSSLESLAARIKALDDLIPSQSHMMADVSEHFTNLWFAGKAGNWPLADFYLSETRSHLRWAVRRIPIRKDNAGHDVNLDHILTAFENSQLAQLKQVIGRKELPGFERTYKECLTVCYSCHKAADKPYLRLQIPTEPVSRIVNFDPQANGPL